MHEEGRVSGRSTSQETAQRLSILFKWYLLTWDAQWGWISNNPNNITSLHLHLALSFCKRTIHSYLTKIFNGTKIPKLHLFWCKEKKIRHVRLTVHSVAQLATNQFRESQFSNSSEKKTSASEALLLFSHTFYSTHSSDFHTELVGASFCWQTRLSVVIWHFRKPF